MVQGGVLAMVALFDSLTGGEVIMVMVVAVMILGPDKMPEAARTLGIWVSKLRSMSTNLQSEVREVLDDPAMQPIREVGEFIASPRQKLMEYATAVESEIRDDEPTDSSSSEADAPAVGAIVDDSPNADDSPSADESHSADELRDTLEIPKPSFDPAARAFYEAL